MPRPKTPLISRRSALQAALDIIDSEGLDALVIRRLGDELGVNGASLYHHFENKEAIRVGAAALALEYVRPPASPDEEWPIWVMRNNRSLRKALLRHPNLIPVVLEHAPLGIGTASMEVSAALLEQQGVPEDLILPLLEGLEMIAISSAMYSRRKDDLGGAELNEDDHPTLMRAASHRDRSAEAFFEDGCAAVIASIQERIAQGRRKPRKTSTARPRAARAKAASA